MFLSVLYLIHLLIFFEKANSTLETKIKVNDLNHFSTAVDFGELYYDSDLMNFTDIYEEEYYYEEHMMKILHVDDKYILVGVLDSMFNLTLPSLQKNYSINKYSNETVRKQCEIFLFKYCRNYIQYILPLESFPRNFLLCGTNSFSPMCNYYYIGVNEVPINDPDVNVEFTWNIVPDSPSHSFVNLISENNRIFSAMQFNRYAFISVSDLGKSDIPNVSNNDEYVHKQLVVNNSKIFIGQNRVNFIKGFEFEKNIYFFFQEEITQEQLKSQNTDAQSSVEVKSQLISLCQFDKEFSKLSNTNTLTLQCGNQSWFIKDVSSVSDEKNEINIVYTLFGNEKFSILCLFDLKLISSKIKSLMKKPCTNNEKSKKDFSSKREEIKDNYLYEGIPLTIENTNYKFEKIAVDLKSRRVNQFSNRFYDVLYIGTSRGTILKIFISGSLKNDHLFENQTITTFDVKARIIEEMFPEIIVSHTSNKTKKIKDLKIHTANEARHLLILYPYELIYFSLSTCHKKANTCSECLALKDPHCAWNIIEDKCQDIFTTSKLKLDEPLFNESKNTFLFLEQLDETDWNFRERNDENPNQKICLNVGQNKKLLLNLKKTHYDVNGEEDKKLNFLLFLAHIALFVIIILKK